MSVTSPVAIVDAVTADLLANSGLTPKQTRKYAEPITIMPDAMPLLSVWLELTQYSLLTGNPPAYERRHTLNVAWYVANPKQSEVGGVGDPAVVKALDTTLETLIAQLTTYTDGLPGGLGPQLVGTLQSRQLAPQEGIVWRGLVELVVEEAT